MTRGNRPPRYKSKTAREVDQQDNLRKTATYNSLAHNRRAGPVDPDLQAEQDAYRARFTASHKRPPEVFDDEE